MRCLIVFVLIFSVLGSKAQKSIFYFGVNGKIEDNNKNHTKVTIGNAKHDRFEVTTYFFDNNQWKKMRNENWKELDQNHYTYSYREGKTSITIARTYSKMGDSLWQFTETSHQKLVRRGTTKQKLPLILDGTITSYYDNGTVSSESVYHNNELISNKNWLDDGVAYYDNLFYSVDRYPAFSRGNDQLNKCIFQNLKENKVDFSRINGQMVIGFVVFEDGQIGGFRVLKGITPHLEQLVINALRDINGTWIPARLNGENVRFFQTFPINFTHDEFQLESFDLSTGIIQFERK